MVQRPLWASTSTKNPAYRDVLYVEQLVGPDTVNTLPPATLAAFGDHGEASRTVDADLAGAERTLADLEALGISMRDVTDKLLVEGHRQLPEVVRRAPRASGAAPERDGGALSSVAAPRSGG
jgi:transaldolase